MTWSPETLAKPSMAPLFHERCVPFQPWSPEIVSQVLGSWNTVTVLPPLSTLLLVGEPPA